ncbi:MAG: hypothetical protein Q9227_001468 [Pyrenula ochraceoflavens]
MDEVTFLQGDVVRQKPRYTVFVNLSVDENCSDPYPERRFHIGPYSSTFRVGRGSKNGSYTLMPSSENAWFESRVVSRTHALFKANAESKRLCIEDDDSMHGTYVNGKRLEQGEVKSIQNNDEIQLGSKVVRGPESFAPLNMRVKFDWEDVSPRTFEVPEQSDSDIEIIEERRRIERSSSNASAQGSFRSVISDEEASRSSSPEEPLSAHDLYIETREDKAPTLPEKSISAEKGPNDFETSLNNVQSPSDIPNTSQTLADTNHWHLPSQITELPQKVDQSNLPSFERPEASISDALLTPAAETVQRSFYSEAGHNDSEDCEPSDDDSEESFSEESDSDDDAAAAEHEQFAQTSSPPPVNAAGEGFNIPSPVSAQVGSPEPLDNDLPESSIMPHDSVSRIELIAEPELSNRGRKMTRNSEAPGMILLGDDFLGDEKHDLPSKTSEIRSPIAAWKQSKIERYVRPEELHNERQSIPPLDFDHAPQRLSEAFSPAQGAFFPAKRADIPKANQSYRAPSPSDAAMAKAIQFSPYSGLATTLSPASRVPLQADLISSKQEIQAGIRGQDQAVMTENAYRRPLSEIRLREPPPFFGTKVELGPGTVKNSESDLNLGQAKEEQDFSKSAPETQSRPHRDQIKVRDLVDSVASSENIPPRGLKRKADQISQSEDIDILEQNLKYCQQAAAENPTPSALEHSNMDTSCDGAEDSLKEPFEGVATEERPSKRARIQQERPARRASTRGRGRAVAKYAATAIGGAVAGAVSVVALLVNLPPHYFNKN